MRHQAGQLKKLLPGSVEENVPLSRYTSFKIGGPADIMVSAKSPEEAGAAVRFCRENDLDYFILGNGTNLLVSDDGYRGVIIRIDRKMGSIMVDGNRITAQCGALMRRLSSAAAYHCLCGLEFAAGIPGMLGGALVMNAGAYGGEMSQVVVAVRGLDQNGNEKLWTKENIGFGYRRSGILPGEVYLEAVMELTPGVESQIRAKITDCQRRRAEKQPLTYPSAGSVFKRPPDDFAGRLIQEAGLKGYSIGGAQVSIKHAGFIINTGGATALEVKRLVEHIQRTVYEKCGVMLQSELRFLGEIGD
ncbi:MAG: UDP-N-acetylmuramate dehydrogenase [Christensenellales bacterium]|jgi:UDP-N-acetylmuramate dehydrogenase